MGALDFEFAGGLIRLARLLREDAIAAAAQGDGDQVVRNLVAVIGMAERRRVGDRPRHGGRPQHDVMGLLARGGGAHGESHCGTDEQT